MSLHSYAKNWVHLVWATLDIERLLPPAAARQVSKHLTRYASDEHIHMEVNHVGPDHVHSLIELPTNMPIEHVFKLLKGESSHWINHRGLIARTFHWEIGYASFSVSESQRDKVVAFIKRQEAYHRKVTFTEEMRDLVRLHGMEWRGFPL